MFHRDPPGVLTTDDIDRIDTDGINVNGGSIAVGHPSGSTDARMITDLVFELHRSNTCYGCRSSERED